jgi:hypothetical protein
VRPDRTSQPSDLAEIMDAWTYLDEAVQTAIMAIIRSSRKSGK